jgi:hypothetical protein
MPRTVNPKVLDIDEGSYLVGQFIDTRPGRVWTGRDGQVRHPQEVTLLIGRTSIRIQYRSSDDAAAALAVARLGDRLMLRVYVRSNLGRVFYDGIAPATEEVAA